MISFSEEKSWKERRRFRRIRLKEPVRYELKDPRQYGGCVAGDISAGGIKIILNDFIPLGTELALQVRLIGSQIVDCPGRAVWVEKIAFGDGYRVGLRFMEGKTSPESREVIHHFVENCLLEKVKK